MLVDVAIAIPDAGPFTYQVPAELAPAVRPGMRVRVPFGNGVRIGYVTGPGSANPGTIKPVLEVLDDRPLLTPELLELTRWLSRYYLCGWGEAIRAALPPGMDGRQVRMVFANGLIEQNPACLKADRRLTDFLGEHRAVSYDYLIRKFGPRAAAELRALQTAGAVGIYSIWQKARVRPKTEQWLVARPGEFVNARAVAQTRLWTLLGQRGELSPGEVRPLRSAAHRLVALGLAAWEQRVVDRLPDAAEFDEAGDSFELTGEQSGFLSAIGPDIDRRTFAVHLLLGVTSSGKSELYLRAARQVLAAGRQVLILVPEIGLTHQMVSRVRRALGAAMVLHSEMGLGERFDAWRLISEHQCNVVVGTRSAVFAPLDNIGLVVIDEEQDSSYKQEDARPFYHARDVAIVRAQAQQAAVILGSATPSVETYHKATAGKFRLFELTRRVAGAALPAVEVIDIKDAPSQGRILSPPLAEALRGCLADDQQAMLLLNRRGLAPYVQCASCGTLLVCPNCSVNLTLHRAGSRLLCHYCGYTRPLDRQCPQCKQLLLLPRGWGIQQLEQELELLFPGEPVLRMDADTTGRKGAHYRILKSFHQGQARILIGTQMIAKGHHFPQVTLVGIANIDDLLGMPDFRAGERAFQLLAQMAGRAGRGGRPGRVLVQTRTPGHPVLAFVAHHDYHGFAAWELAQRSETGYPPYARVALITLAAPAEQQAQLLAQRAYEMLRDQRAAQVLGPAPAGLYRLRGMYRWQLLLKYQWPGDLERSGAVRMARELGGRVSVNVEPATLM